MKQYVWSAFLQKIILCFTRMCCAISSTAHCAAWSWVIFSVCGRLIVKSDQRYRFYPQATWLCTINSQRSCLAARSSVCCLIVNCHHLLPALWADLPILNCEEGHTPSPSLSFLQPSPSPCSSPHRPFSFPHSFPFLSSPCSHPLLVSQFQSVN